MEKVILLVDDERDICDVLSISLSDLGYKVLTAQSGEEALKILRRVNPPLVLTDIRMPFMDGTELLREIKHQNPDTEVIMLTGHGDMDLAVKSLKLEATDFITKPIKDDVLEIALKRALEKISMKRQLREHTENLEKLVREKTTKLLEAERMAAVGETIAGLSHAIKNIAGGLEGGTFVLEKGIELDNKQYIRQGWEAVRVSFEKIRDLSVDLLNYAKHADLRHRLCDPNEPAREVVGLMQSRAAEHGIDLKTDLAPDLDVFLFDPDAIHHCLLNLVANALDATQSDDHPKAQKEVLVKTSRAEGWGVEYQVADDGCGMGKEVREKIFSSFFSTKGATGTGIGLMMTKKIIEDHGGVIEFESEEGAGTKFIIRLPVRA
ncbi:MAG: response regulator receiver protein [Nitrospira bacterium SG8_3]|nr:MAG: response regulator receiver protein [Nitrospira bacterium SG8_3]